MKKYSLGQVPLTSPLMNAAGTCKTLEEVRDLSRVEDIGAIMLGSITMEMRHGNSGEVFRTTSLGALNSLGMPNAGSISYREMMPEMVSIAHERNKAFGVSVAAIGNMKEYVLLAHDCVEAGADFIELNLGCPNVWDAGVQHRILTFDPGAVDDILFMVAPILNGRPLCIKVSPISDPVYLNELAAVIGSRVTAVTAVNTFPNGHGRFISGRQLIDVGKGLAGVSGAALKLIGRGQVLQWRDALPDDVQVIAAGGIDCGQDIMDYGKNGAELFQIATAYFQKGPGIFGEVLAEAEMLLSSEPA